MRVVIDTNVIVSSYIAPRGPIAAVVALLSRPGIDLVLSPEILAEYERVLNEPGPRALHRKTEEEIDEVIRRFKSTSLFVDPTERLQVVKDDPNDDKFLECAVEGKAAYVVSGDKHLLALGSYRGIEILRPAAFVLLVAMNRSP